MTTESLKPLINELIATIINNLILFTIMGIYYSKSTGEKLVVVAKTAAQRFKMAMTYGLSHSIVDFKEVEL